MVSVHGNASPSAMLATVGGCAERQMQETLTCRQNPGQDRQRQPPPGQCGNRAITRAARRTIKGAGEASTGAQVGSSRDANNQCGDHRGTQKTPRPQCQ